jgi:hypothetical protein
MEFLPTDKPEAPLMVLDARVSDGVAITETDVVPLGTDTSLPGISALIPFTVKVESVEIAVEPEVSRNRTGSRTLPLTIPSSSPVPPSVIVIVTVRLSISESEVTSTNMPLIRLKTLVGVDPTGKSMVKVTELPEVKPPTV